MLFLTTVISWDSKKAGRRVDTDRVYINAYVLNTNRISDLKVWIDDDGEEYSKFLYSDDPDDARDSPANVICASTVAEIEAYHNLVYTSKFGTLPVFPDMDTTQATVDTTVEWDDIAYGYGSAGEIGVNHAKVVYYENAWKRKEVLVDQALLLLALLPIT